MLNEMKPKNKAKIIDITEKPEYEKYLYKCLAPMPFRKYKKRHEYLTQAIPKGFRKKILTFNGDTVGTIEYAPTQVMGLSIKGDNIIVMNCIWVLRRAKGHNFGKQLIDNMVKSEKNAAGFATIGLENHWSGWMRKDQMERLSFKAIDSFKVKHKTKNTDRCFTMYLMWLPKTKNAKPPTWNKTKLLQGVHLCMGHPLYHPESLKQKEIYEKCQPQTHKQQ
jgi:hypothetical protein